MDSILIQSIRLSVIKLLICSTDSVELFLFLPCKVEENFEGKLEEKVEVLRQRYSLHFSLTCRYFASDLIDRF